MPTFAPTDPRGIRAKLAPSVWRPSRGQYTKKGAIAARPRFTVTGVIFMH